MVEKQVYMRFNPSEPSKLDNIIRGSYDDFVRLKRRNLLAISSLTLFFIFGKAQPSEVIFFGVKLPHIDAANLFTALFLVSLYFSIAYFIYAYPNYRDAKSKWKELKNSAMQIIGNKHRLSIEAKNLLSTTRYYSWLFVNYIFPFLLGVISTVLAFCKIA